MSKCVPNEQKIVRIVVLEGQNIKNADSDMLPTLQGSRTKLIWKVDHIRTIVVQELVKKLGKSAN